MHYLHSFMPSVGLLIQQVCLAEDSASCTWHTKHVTQHIPTAYRDGERDSNATATCIIFLRSTVQIKLIFIHILYVYIHTHTHYRPAKIILLTFAVLAAKRQSTLVEHPAGEDPQRQQPMGTCWHKLQSCPSLRAHLSASQGVWRQKGHCRWAPLGACQD